MPTPRSSVQTAAAYHKSIAFWDEAIAENLAAFESADLRSRSGITYHTLGYAMSNLLRSYSAGTPVDALRAPAARVGEAYRAAQAATKAYADSLPGDEGQAWRKPVWKTGSVEIQVGWEA